MGIDLQKQQLLDAGPNSVQINFTGNLDCAGNTTILFNIEEEKQLVWIFHKEP